jgi:hypothetical protein
MRTGGSGKGGGRHHVSHDMDDPARATLSEPLKATELSNFVSFVFFVVNSYVFKS